MSYDEIRKRFEKEEAEKRGAATASMKGALAELKKDSVKKIIVEYDGHDDEGFVQRIVAVKADGSQIENGPKTPAARPESLDRIEDFVLSVLPGAWETNEGGFGTCVINVDTGDYDLKHIWGRGKPYQSM